MTGEHQARLRRDEVSFPVGKDGSAASPDNDRIPQCTPGPAGVGDASSCRHSDLAAFRLSGKLELHFVRREDIATSGEGEGAWCLFEYDGASGGYFEADQLTYPHGRNRRYYQVGDVILIMKISPTLLRTFYPEAARLVSESEALLDVANSLGLELTIGWQLLDITSDGVIARLVLVFGEDCLYAVEDVVRGWVRTSPFPGRALEPAFRSARLDLDGWEFVKWIAPKIAALATGVLQGAARGAMRSVAVSLAKSQVKKKVAKSLVLRALGTVRPDFKKATVAFAKEAAKKFVEVSLRPGDTLGRADVERILVAGFAAFAGSLISSLGESVIGQLPEAGSFQGWVAKRLAEETLRMFPNTINVLIGAHAGAFDKLRSAGDAGRGSARYQELLARELEQKLMDPAKSAAERLFFSSGGLGAAD